MFDASSPYKNAIVWTRRWLSLLGRLDLDKALGKSVVFITFLSPLLPGAQTWPAAQQPSSPANYPIWSSSNRPLSFRQVRRGRNLDQHVTALAYSYVAKKKRKKKKRGQGGPGGCACVLAIAIAIAIAIAAYMYSTLHIGYQIQAPCACACAY
ncbi:hypothetical protein BP00DRAFT_130069 [Aspergillus indologenus CBS 114.80]|uniref:Uncharacterized protein n=1 Tax=Aspergillus indologenus CBS 114.80 TaxID=1450541 RepID=A0A2V5J5X3_9EURO|nr:hypothetical protein BP00DRAFT_130069 [Aspergillus indologenus CBS 114.80]